MTDDLIAWLTQALHTTPHTPALRPRRRLEDLPADHPWAWTNQAACTDVDPDLFFPDSSTTDPAAIAACKTCPVLEPCRDWAIHHEDHGYWGGMSERARRKARRSLGITLATNPDPDTDDPTAPDEDLAS